MPQQNQDQMPLGKHIHSLCKSNTKSKTIAVEKQKKVIPEFSVASVLPLLDHGIT